MQEYYINCLSPRFDPCSFPSPDCSLSLLALAEPYRPFILSCRVASSTRQGGGKLTLSLATWQKPTSALSTVIDYVLRCTPNALLVARASSGDVDRRRCIAKLREEAGFHHHLSCSDYRFVVIQYVLQIQHASAARPHFFSLCDPVPASQKNVLHVLDSLAAGTLVCICLVDAEEVRSQADLAGPHLADDRADRSG